MSLNFDLLRSANELRNSKAFPTCAEWTGVDWSNAMAGEVGEACNVVKKIKRDGSTCTKIDDLAKELADVVCYADLLAAHYGVNLGEAVRQKFNEVSFRVKSSITI